MILMIRCEIVCLIILLYLMIYSLMYIDGIVKTHFMKICCFANVHIIFDIITIYTVNHLETVPPLVNKWCHIFFYYAAILFCYEMLSYATDNVMMPKLKKVVKYITRAIVILYIVCAPFLEITYVKGRGTYYSFGMCVYAGYATAMVFALLSVIILVVNIKHLQTKIIMSVLPMSCILIIFMIIQIIVPELLFTGAAATIVIMGMFIIYENPVEEYKAKSYMDLDTGVKNRNCFDVDFLKYKNRFQMLGYTSGSIGIVLCDLNNLKATNDTYGHAVGDRFLQIIAQILKKELRNSKEIYRVGGDEFVAIYMNINDDVIREEIDAVYNSCKQENDNYEFPLSIAIGYSVTSYTDDLDTAYTKADADMYRNKQDIKSRQKEYLKQ